MERQSFDASIFYSVHFIAGHRMSLFRKLDPDLVLRSGKKIDFQQAKLVRFPDDPVTGFRKLSLSDY
ncbi:hypothetical protein SD074_00180 [Prolixibacter sp. SD074]|nr:hypothetical protein SD074_00180 [Prolixibacter sp. SD074]